LHATDDDAAAWRGGGEFGSSLQPERKIAASRLSSTPRMWALATREAYRKETDGERVA
jgi:hypothetical protein